jgi:hypothetical protein
MNKAVLLIPIAAAAVLTGCGSSSKTAADTGTTSPTAAPSSTAPVTVTVNSPSSATATAAPVSGPATCASATVSVILGAGDGAAGSTYYPLHFTNTGSATCTITGFPGVSFVAPGDGVQVGSPAARSGSSNGTVTLAPGAEATAVLQVADYANFTPSDCDATAVSGFRVYVPGNTAASYVALPSVSMACSKDLTATGSAELVVEAVKAGATGM